MSFALLEIDPRFGLPTVKALSDAKFGPDTLRWVDAPPGTSVGDVLTPDGKLGPHVPPLADARAHKLREVKADCATEIVGGFASSALGAEYRYGSTVTDRENIDRAAMAALSGQKDPAWVAQIQCAPEGGERVLTDHTAAQVHQVSADLHAFIQARQARHESMKGQIAGAATTAAVQAITWG